MYWGRRFCLLSRSLNNPVTTVLWLMGVKSEVRLLRVVAVMMVDMRAAINRRVISPSIAIVVRVWNSPYLALLRSSGPIILLGEAMRLVYPLSRPLLLLVGKQSCSLIREVAVVAPPTHVVMWVMAASLGPNLSANWWWSLIGCPSVRAGLLMWSQSTFSHAVWRSVTPNIKKMDKTLNKLH